MSRYNYCDECVHELREQEKAYVGLINRNNRIVSRNAALMKEIDKLLGVTSDERQKEMKDAGLQSAVHLLMKRYRQQADALATLRLG